MRLIKKLKYVYYAWVMWSAFMLLEVVEDIQHPQEAAYLYPIDTVYVSTVVIFILWFGLTLLKEKVKPKDKPQSQYAPRETEL